MIVRMHLWCNGYHRKEWISWPELKILDDTVCILHSADTIGKSVHLTILYLAMGK